MTFKSSFKTAFLPKTLRSGMNVSIMRSEDVSRAHGTEIKADQYSAVASTVVSGLVRSLMDKVYLSMASSHTIISN